MSTRIGLFRQNRLSQCLHVLVSLVKTDCRLTTRIDLFRQNRTVVMSTRVDVWSKQTIAMTTRYTGLFLQQQKCRKDDELYLFLQY